MIKLKYTALLAVIAVSSFTSCRKKPVPSTTGSMNIEITNQMEGVALDLGNSWYKTPHGDSLMVNTLMYYLSNFTFTTADGKTYTEPESYHLVDAARPESRALEFKNVPPGTYTSVKFMIGVDSLRNVSGAQTGDLDPGKGMFWTWNSGYIMAKMEGRSPQSGHTPADSAVVLHIGGYDGTFKSQRWVTLQLPGSGASVDGNKSAPKIHMMANLAEWFRTPNTIDFSKVYFVMGVGKDAKNIADNYVDMFTIDHIH